MAQPTELLADGPDYRITLHHATRRKPADGSKRVTAPLVITFGGAPSGLSAAGFGTGWALALGWDTIYVAQRTETQYQLLSQDAFADAIAPVAAGRDVVCYGSSLGGYAALYFGGALDCRIVAAAPMLPAWPPLQRPLVDMIPILHLPLEQARRSSRSPVVLYDPMVAADQKMVGSMVLPAYPNTRFIRLEFSGHTVLQMLARTKLINKVLPPLLGEDRIVEFTVDTDNSIWHFQKGRHLMHDQPIEARMHFERSLELEPSRHVASNLLVLLLRGGDKIAAQALIDHVARTAPPGKGIALAGLARAKAAGMDVSAFDDPSPTPVQALNS